MRARSCVVVATGGVLREITSEPPLTLRRLYDPDRSLCALAVVGSAAGPLDGDDLGLSIEVQSHARATLVAAGASVAMGGGVRDPARVTIDIRVGAGAHFSGDTGALIATAGCALDVTVRIALSGDATVSWTELVALGRTGEPAGPVRLTWDVERAGWPLLRQTTDLRDPVRREWPGTIAGARVLAGRLRVGPDVTARTLALSSTAAAHALAPDAELITVLAPDALTARAQLCELAAPAGLAADSGDRVPIRGPGAI